MMSEKTVSQRVLRDYSAAVPLWSCGDVKAMALCIMSVKKTLRSRLVRYNSGWQESE